MKENILKSFLAVGVVSALFAANVGASASSIENTNIESTTDHVLLDVQGKKIEFNLDPEVQGKISNKALEGIVGQVDDGDVITIHKIVPASSSPGPISSITRLNNTGDVSTNAWYDLWVNWDPLIKSNISRDNATSAQQIISVAAGKTISLSSSVTKKTSASVGVQASAPKAQINGSITQEISTTYSTNETWTGPSEASGYRSRIFYWTGYVDRGSYSIRGYGNLSGDLYGPYTGSYTEPTYYIEWSRDI